MTNVKSKLLLIVYKILKYRWYFHRKNVWGKNIVQHQISFDGWREILKFPLQVELSQLKTEPLLWFLDIYFQTQINNEITESVRKHYNTNFIYLILENIDTNIQMANRGHKYGCLELLSYEENISTTTQ